MSETFQATDDRRLAAILAADVVGYSRLMGRDEAATVRDLEAHKAVVLAIIAKHGGAVINIAGDGVIAQFPSAVRAVECAVAIQKIMAERNAETPKARRMLLRIGVNLGDIIHDPDKTYGDGINVAARLEPLAEPGGICISATVRDAIFGKLGLPLLDLGDRTLKNIDRPIHIFQIQPPGARPRRNWLGLNFRRRRRLGAALGALAILAGVGLAAWRLWPRDALASDYTPVITVSPFASADGDAGLDRLGPSLSREVSTMLSSYPGFRVMSPESASALGRRDTGRRYTLGGDLMKSGDNLQVRSRLLDAASGETVWSDSYTFAKEDPIAVQKKTAERIFGALGGYNGRVNKLDQEAAWRKPESDLTAYDFSLRALSYTNKYTFDNNLRGRKIAEQGLARFPDTVILKIRLAWTYLLESDAVGPFENCRETIEAAYRIGREVEEAKNKSLFEIYQTRKLMAHSYAWHGEEFDRAIDEAQAQIEMNPYDAVERATLAFYLASAGQVDKALEWTSWAIAHDYQDFFWVKANTAWIYYLAGRYEDALQALKGVEATHPWPAIVIYVRLGRLLEARAAVAEWLKTGPHSVTSESCAPLRQPMKQKYLDDLRKAGVPEKAETQAK